MARKNQWQVAKEIQKRFWDEFDLIITRDQALEVMRSLKRQVAMFCIDGHYVSTNGRDDVVQASVRGVNYFAYRTFYSTREWNNAVEAGEFGNVNNPYAEFWRGGEYYVPRVDEETGQPVR